MAVEIVQILIITEMRTFQVNRMCPHCGGQEFAEVAEASCSIPLTMCMKCKFLMPTKVKG